MALQDFEYPLNISGSDLLEPIADTALFRVVEDEVGRAVDLFNAAKTYLASLPSDTPASADALATAAREIRRSAYNIQQSHNRYGGSIITHIRSSRLAIDASLTDANCLAALALDRACWAVKVIGDWLIEFDEQCPPDADADAFRNECAAEERDALASARDYLEMAANCLSEAEASTRLAAEQRSKAAEAAAKAATAREGGKQSGKKRRESVEERNADICDKAKSLLRAGYAQRDIVGIIQL